MIWVKVFSSPLVKSLKGFAFNLNLAICDVLWHKSVSLNYQRIRSSVRSPLVTVLEGLQTRYGIW